MTLLAGSAAVTERCTGTLIGTLGRPLENRATVAVLGPTAVSVMYLTVPVIALAFLILPGTARILSTATGGWGFAWSCSAGIA